MRFNAPRLTFGRAPADDTTPTPLLRRDAARKTAALAEARDVLAVLPGEGGSLHALMTGRYDLMALLAVLVERLGTVEAMHVATLAFSKRNLAAMVQLLDSGHVQRLTLLCSKFFAEHNRGLWSATLEEFRERGQRAAAARSHAKVVTLAVADGRRFVVEGSANIRSNSNAEQIAVIHDTPLYEWHRRWIDDWVSRHEGDQGDRSGTD